MAGRPSATRCPAASRSGTAGDVLIADAGAHEVLSLHGCRLGHFEPTSGAYYRIADTCTGRPLGRWGPATEWRIDPDASGTYQLTNRIGTTLTGRRLLAP